MKVNPYWVTGFIDGEGCFQAFYGCNNYLHVSFKVNQRDDDTKTVYKLYDYFKVGNIYHINNNGRRIFGDKANVKDVIRYQVKSIVDLYNKIIPHFDKYPLQSKKLQDYLIWRKIIVIAYKYYRKPISNNLNEELGNLCKQLKEVRSYPNRLICGRKRTK